MRSIPVSGSKTAPTAARYFSKASVAMSVKVVPVWKFPNLQCFKTTELKEIVPVSTIPAEESNDVPLYRMF